MSSAKFTDRQRQVCELLADGLSHAEIAQRLSIAKSTVADHVNRMLVQHKCRNAAQLVARFLRP